MTSRAASRTPSPTPRRAAPTPNRSNSGQIACLTDAQLARRAAGVHRLQRHAEGHEHDLLHPHASRRDGLPRRLLGATARDCERRLSSTSQATQLLQLPRRDQPRQRGSGRRQHGALRRDPVVGGLHRRQYGTSSPKREARQDERRRGMPGRRQPHPRSRTRAGSKTKKATRRASLQDLIVNQIAVEQANIAHRPAAQLLEEHHDRHRGDRRMPERVRRHLRTERAAGTDPAAAHRGGHALQRGRGEGTSTTSTTSSTTATCTTRAAWAASASWPASPPPPGRTPAKAWPSTAWSRR